MMARFCHLIVGNFKGAVSCVTGKKPVRQRFVWLVCSRMSVTFEILSVYKRC